MPVRTYSRTSAWRAMWPLFFDREQYLRIAAEHEVAISLRSADYHASYEKGEYPKPGWESAAASRASGHMKGLFRGLRRSFAVTLAFAAIGGLVAFAIGKLDPTLPFAAGKALSLAGALLAAWPPCLSSVVMCTHSTARPCTSFSIRRSSRPCSFPAWPSQLWVSYGERLV